MPKDKAAERAKKCFALAAHANTPADEAAAALAAGLAMLEKHGLDPDNFDIPGRERTSRLVWPLTEPQRQDLADIFGSCAGCGAVCSTGAYCRSCQLKAETQTCEHGQHGFCLQCERA